MPPDPPTVLTTVAPTLSDGSVTLRPVTPDDVASVVEQSLDPETVRWTSVPPNAIAQSLAYIDSRLDVRSIYEMVDWYRNQRMIEKGTDPAKFIDLCFVEGHINIPAAMKREC